MSLVLSLLISNPGPPSAERIGFSVVGWGMVSSAKSETLCLCRNEKQLKKALKDMGINEDFGWPSGLGKGAVIIAFLGQRRTGGYGLDPVGVYRVDYNAARVSWEMVWDMAIVPLLEGDGIDPASVPTAPIDRPGDAVVVIRETCPPEGAMVIQMITSPYIILAVPDHKLREVHVRFVRCSQ
ncbi:MAG: protease complex subunit PrcB family protein [candidate division WOR-3 bacterium]